jgi:3-isopropylmalate/(R)-2-methylmalate dehydratase small subunit
MKTFSGKVLFLDRNDINTDEIIPAKYLTEITKEALAPHCLEDLKLPGFEPGRDVKDKGALISRANFGCGSSREHAPWALEMNGIRVVVAQNFARIFRGNMFNGGLLAIELAGSDIDDIFATFAAAQTTLTADPTAGTLELSSKDTRKTYQFKLGEFEKALVASQGWVGYANSAY